MWSKKTFLSATAVLMLTTAANAEVVLKLNGLDATTEFAEIKGKNSLIIAVGSTSLTTGAASTEVEPNTYFVKADYGAIKAIAGDDTNSPQAKTGEYSFTFEDELVPGTVSLIANNDMVIDGTSVKAGDKIYELVLFYITETDTVMAVGVNLEILSCAQPEAEAAAEPQPVPELKLEPTAEAQAEPAPTPKPKPKPFLAMSEQEHKRLRSPLGDGLRQLRRFPEDRGQMTEEAIRASGYQGIELSGQQDIGEQGSEELFSGFDTLTTGDSNLIVIPDGNVINTNTIWDTNVYLLGCVEVNNAMLVIKPGVTVWVAYLGLPLPYGGIVVRNNGCIIANGTPDKNIIFRSAAGVPYEGYYFAIVLDETASSASQISYCTIADAYVGIWALNKRLDNPIHDNSIWLCCYGIGLEGPMLTDIVNNEIMDCALYGVVANLADVNGVASNTAEILIGNNTIVSSYKSGIVVSGVEDPNQAGEVTIANNLIAASGQYAIYPVNGWMKLATYCNGFYANYGDVYGGTGGGWMSGGTKDANSVIVEDFNSYECTNESECGDKALRVVWKDHYTQPPPNTSAEVYVEKTTVIDGNSMKYEYMNCYWPYYSEAEAEIGDLPSGVGSDWTSGDVNTLTLYFYGQLGNDSGEQMYVNLTDGDETDFNSVDNFDSYNSTTIKQIWKDYWSNGSCAEVFPETTIVRSVQSMKYVYSNQYPPYYSEAEADIAALETNDPNWLGIWDGTLSLWFYGQAGNDANEPMYVKLVDGEEQTATVFYRNYGAMNDVREERWHVWNIHIADFYVANFFIDLSNVAKIVIGFGDGNPPAASDGVVFFEDIRLYKEYPPPEHSATVIYDGYPEYIKEPRWHVWNIALAEFNDVNLANITKIAIGFGDGTSPGGEPNGKGTVYFEDIILREGPAEDIYYDGSVYLDEDPFENGYLGYPLLLKQDCRLIDAGGEYIDEQQYLIGKTTAWEGFPDSKVADIGFHYFNWYYVNAGDSNGLNADLNQDEIVNFNDFAILADDWLTTYDMNDLKIMASEWLWAAGAYPPIAATITGDPNNLTGKVLIRISGLPYNITKGFIYVDGALKGYIDYMMGAEANNCAPLDTQKLGNCQHGIKVATVDINGLITMSQAITVDTNNELYYVNKANYFEPNEGYHIYAMSDTNSNFRVHLAGWDGNTIWTSDASSGGLNVTVPSDVLTGQIYDIVLEKEDGIAMSSESDEGDTIKNRRRTPGPYKVAIFLPNGVTDSGVFTSNSRMRAVAELMRWCEQRHMNYTILYRGECTWENFASVLSQPTVSYVYMVGHGNDHIGTEPNVVNRLNFVVSSPDFGYWGTETVVSHKSGLPGNMDSDPRVHSMESLGLNEIMQIRCVYMTVCRQGVSDEMARQWLDWSMGTPLNQLFCGWDGCPQATDPDWQDWDYQFWHRWGSGDELASKVIGGPFIPGGLFGRYPGIWADFAPIGWTQMYFTTSGN